MLKQRSRFILTTIRENKSDKLRVSSVTVINICEQAAIILSYVCLIFIKIDYLPRITTISKLCKHFN